MKYKYHCSLIENSLKNTKNGFLALITRCKNEFFIEEFCYYYLGQGVDKIFILDDDSSDLHIYDNIKNNPKIKIIYTKNNSKCHEQIKCEMNTCTCNRVLANMIYKNIKSKFQWMIYVDVDEFIATRKDISKTIKNELKTTYRNIDCIKVPWIMMSPIGKKNPTSVLRTNVYRLNYDSKPNFTCNSRQAGGKFGNQLSGRIAIIKSIFKCHVFDSIQYNDHIPSLPNKKKIISLESVENSFHKYNQKNIGLNLTESRIKKSYLLCYHYRVVCEEHAKKKLSTNSWYIENGYKLVHLVRGDRSIVDNTMKYKSVNQMLKFVHITKTSGTYIENLGFEKNIFWGRFDNKLKYLCKLEPSIADWHIPLFFKNENPYDKNTKLFTIVRNPYDRISECFCKWESKLARNKINTVLDFNTYLRERLLNIDIYNIGFLHFIPQYLYTHNLKDGKTIDYIIKYEEIDEFNKLMKEYSLDIKYLVKRHPPKKFTIKDITKDNMILINRVYRLDFYYFNYDMITKF